jgi:hypothetical protein
VVNTYYAGKFKLVVRDTIFSHKKQRWQYTGVDYGKVSKIAQKADFILTHICIGMYFLMLKRTKWQRQETLH